MEKKNPEKIILKTTGIPGVNKAVVDFTMACTVPVTITRVISPMFVKGSKTFIGLSERLLPGEVIQVGNLNLTYKIVSADNNNPDTPKGYIYRIRRVDRLPTTATDINAIVVGKFAKIKNRRSFKQKFDQVNELLNS